MSAVTQTPYVVEMQTETHVGLAHARRDLPRVYCAACAHTEFVHSDGDERRCLYSECGCSGFTQRGNTASSPSPLAVRRSA
jgi:hypothetical protein